MKPRPALLGEDAVRDSVERVLQAAAARSMVPGWATVELDRAEVELTRSYDGAGQAARPDVPRVPWGPGPMPERSGGELPEPASDGLLGARWRILWPGLLGSVVILEPSTEGPLAAALARHGEGYVALYLIVDAGAPDRIRRAGFTVSVAGTGPFGAQLAVRVARSSGPFIVLTGVQ